MRLWATYITSSEKRAKREGSFAPKLPELNNKKIRNRFLFYGHIFYDRTKSWFLCMFTVLSTWTTCSNLNRKQVTIIQQHFSSEFLPQPSRAAEPDLFQFDLIQCKSQIITSLNQFIWHISYVGCQTEFYSVNFTQYLCNVSLLSYKSCTPQFFAD